MVDTDAAPAVAAPGGPGPTTRAWTRRRLVAVGGSLAAVLLLIIGYVVWSRPLGPTEAVSRYLDALRHHKVADALRVAHADRPDGVQATFLTADAIGGWTFTAPKERNTFDNETEVTVDLVDTTGHPLTVPAAVTGVFHLTHRHDGWHIDNPFVTVSFDAEPLWYLRLNGVQLSGPVDPAARFLLFPGLYQTYETHSAEVTVTPGRLYALPMFSVPPRSDPPTIRLTGQGTQTYQQAANGYLDRCLAQQSQPQKTCTVKVRRDFYEPGDAVVDPGKLRTAAWTVARYPTVNLPGTRAQDPSGRTVLRGQVEIPGEAHLAATGADLDGKTVLFTMTCLITDEGLSGSVGPDGSLSVDQLGAGDWIMVDCY